MAEVLEGTSFLLLFFDILSGILRKKHLFSEQHLKKIRSVLEEMSKDTRQNRSKPVKTSQNRSGVYKVLLSCVPSYHKPPNLDAMATITKGILGGFSGTVGTVVGANWRGKDIIRSRPKTTQRVPTEKQLLQQAKFKLVIGFLQPVKPIQSLYFGTGSGVKSRVNMAVSYTIQEAVDVVLNIPHLMYNKVLMTKGELTGFQNPEVVADTDGVLRLTWEDNSTQGNALATDQVSLIAYCEEMNIFEIFTNIALRPDLSADVTLPAYCAGKTMQVWVYLNNEKQTAACNSPYLGEVTII